MFAFKHVSLFFFKLGCIITQICTLERFCSLFNLAICILSYKVKHGSSMHFANVTF